MSTIDRLRKLDLRIGIHTAPPGTLFYFLHSRARALLHRHTYRYASGQVHFRARFGGTPFYDIERIRCSRQVDGLALIFFIGLGDYLFATPVIEALLMAYPGLLIHAYTSTSADKVNSPLVADMLRANRYIDAVFTYRGRPGRYWIHYDFSDCLKDIQKNFIILPVIYNVEPATFHRVTSLYETFSLPVRLPVAVPLLELGELSAAVSELREQTRRTAGQNSASAIVICHFGTRSSDYLYPRRDELVSLLLKSGRVVVTFSACELADPRLITVDVSEITPSDTIELLRVLKNGDHSVHLVSVNSVMWPISAALGLTNLGLHIFFDPSIHQYLYPNTFVITHHVYPRVSPHRLFLASDEDYLEREQNTGTVVTDFDPKFVFECYENMIGLFHRGPS